MLAGLVLAAGSAGADPIAISGVRILDGNGGAALANATLVVDSGRIAAIGVGIAIPRGSQRRNYAGRTIIPGLISDHSHVGLVAGTGNGAEDYTHANITAQLRQYRRYGVTTVAALGLNGPAFETIRAEAHAGLVDGADLFGVDHGIGVPGGGPPQATIRVSPDQIYRPGTAQEAREDVRRMAAHKTDLVKLWLDDFGGSAPKMKPEIYDAVIEESHRLGLRVAAHIHDLVDAEAIVDAGADILAHGVRDREVPVDFLAKLKQRGVWYIATLNSDESSFAWADQAPWTRTPFARAALSQALARQIDDPAWRTATQSAASTAAARRSLEMNLHNLKLVYDAGVKVGFGTDSGAVPLRVPGIAEHRELALLVEAGLTPLQALSLATRDAAALLGKADRGVLAVGKRADFTVLGADPSQDIAATESIIEVWEAGRSVPGPLQRRYRRAGD